VALVPQQVFQQFELADGELDAVPAARNLALHQIDLEIGNCKPDIFCDPAAASERTDAPGSVDSRKKARLSFL